ncbi:MAG: hypothetical protein LBH24_06775 [Clostridiales bacterium]|nr:hypothetical protein [Clostridiales bacterium]
MLKRDCDALRAAGVRTTSIGRSVLGRDIPALFIGREGGASVIVTAAIHARESLTARLVMRQAEHLRRSKLFGGGIWFVPMVNPDGCLFAARGMGAFDGLPPTAFARERALMSALSIDTPPALFKSNIRGVDLNVNFAAGWGRGARNVRAAGAENYIGPHPFSEPETRALRAFTQAVAPLATLSYHAKGRELYWYFGQDPAAAARDRRIAHTLNKRLGYRLVDGDMASAGGYKDWCIAALKIPAFTVEIIDDARPHPLRDGDLKPDIARNLELPRILLREATRA